jgi:hypothetical protein
MISVFLIHCATKPEVITKEDEKEILRSRVNEYWQYLIEGKVDKAYLFEIPEYREKNSLLQYMNPFKVMRYVEADISEINMEGEKGRILVKVTHIMLLKHLANKRFTEVKEDLWVKIQETWYHIPQGFET